MPIFQSKNLYLNLLIEEFLHRLEIRIGDQNHKDHPDNSGALILQVTGIHKHPKYDGESSYFDVAVFTTNAVKLTTVNFNFLEFCSVGNF